MHLPPTLAERKRLIQQMGKGETSWRKERLKWPFRGKGTLSEQGPEDAHMPLFCHLDAMLIQVVSLFGALGTAGSL